MADFFAHSNYTELALIEMGERDVFPHVGRRTMMGIQGARGEVFPLVTGTFGGVDFISSLCGEVRLRLLLTSGVSLLTSRPGIGQAHPE